MGRKEYKKQLGLKFSLLICTAHFETIENQNLKLIIMFKNNRSQITFVLRLKSIHRITFFK